jgi:hypothetical protein
MRSFFDRIGATDEFISLLHPLLSDAGIAVHEYGQTVLLAGGTDVSAALKRLLVGSYSLDDYGAGFVIKFAPDFLCVVPGYEPFFLDTKASCIPILFGSVVTRLQALAEEDDLPVPTRGEIGVIEREAWDCYARFYPGGRVAVCYAAPYHQRLVAVDWRWNIHSFYRYEANRNPDAGGSGTPHVNIHLGLMRSLVDFFAQEFNVYLDKGLVKRLEDEVKEWRIQKPTGKVNWKQFTTALEAVRKECPWAVGKFPDIPK